MIRLILISLSMFLLASCKGEAPINAEFGSCVSCHKEHNDGQHRIRCTTCHKGDDTITTQLESHSGLVAHPAHPDHMAESCAPCHGETVAQIVNTSHFTLHKSSNIIRRAFGADEDIASFTQTPVVLEPETSLELADDLLRRRCYTCHLYDSGSKYPSTGHGQGCGACHLPYYEGKLQSHVFAPPEDKQCLSCHYGNYVGFDYYGRFEHDFNWEYRTPYTTSEDYFRPYGIEYHQLSSDIHLQKGLLCIDCHSGGELMKGADGPDCASCHDPDLIVNKVPPGVERVDGAFQMTSHTGEKHMVPMIAHSAHERYGKDVRCQACHAQWSFGDNGKYLLRSDTDDMDSFSLLTVQGNYEIERLLENNFDFDKDEFPIAMTDGITGDKREGIWLKSYLTRRWEEIVLGRDENGRIAVMRPTLDYHLSWIDEDETVRFDDIIPEKRSHILTPYTPHTTGKAGLFYGERIRQFLKKEQQPATSSRSLTSENQ